jgi:hypothetical protein
MVSAKPDLNVMDEFGVTEGRRWRWVAPDARVSVGC